MAKQASEASENLVGEYQRITESKFTDDHGTEFVVSRNIKRKPSEWLLKNHKHVSGLFSDYGTASKWNFDYQHRKYTLELTGDKAIIKPRN